VAYSASVHERIHGICTCVAMNNKVNHGQYSTYYIMIECKLHGVQSEYYYYQEYDLVIIDEFEDPERNGELKSVNLSKGQDFNL
jgi:effector-binding domain-containing protein